MDSGRLQHLDNYAPSVIENASQGEYERLLRKKFEGKSYKTADSYEFTPKSSCLGIVDNPHFQERLEKKDQIRAAIQRYRRTRKLFHVSDEIPILKGMDYEFLTVDNRPVVLGEGETGLAYLAKNVNTNKLVTIKVFKKGGRLRLKDILTELGYQMFIQEKANSSFIPNIVGLLVFMEQKVPKDFFPIMIVMDYLSVLPSMAKPMKLSLRDAKRYAKNGCNLFSARD